MRVNSKRLIIVSIIVSALCVLLFAINIIDKINKMQNKIDEYELLVEELEKENEELVGINLELGKEVDMLTAGIQNIQDKLIATKEELDAIKQQSVEIVEEETYTYTIPQNDCLTPSKGVHYGVSGKETYYNLDMSGVISIMRSMGNNDPYWIREDGVKMLGNYVMIAANLNIRPRGSLVETSLGTGIVCDTGGFAEKDQTQIDIAVNW